MIRRISKNNDLKDIIKSCPSGVIDDIYKIEYYIQGYTTSIEATFSKVNKVLEVILPTEDLQTLPNGILMRKAYYKVVDSSYPDGYYNLEFEDNMNIWLGESEGIVPPSPTPGEYVTEEEFVSTLSSYATQNWVSSNQFATQSWVSNKGYLTSVPSSYATKSWVEAQGYITSTGVSGLATMSWVESQGYITSAALSGYATESWVEYFVENNDQNPCVRAEAFDTFLSTGLQDYGFATQSWVTSQGYLTEVPSEYATQSWVESQGYITSTGLSGLATQSWVLSQGFLTSVPEGYATESWVSSQGYLTAVPAGYATESWVSSQGYIKSTALSDYATKSWATSEFFEESKIWTGTQSEWNTLTPAQQALYTIALVTE